MKGSIAALLALFCSHSLCCVEGWLGLGWMKGAAAMASTLVFTLDTLPLPQEPSLKDNQMVQVAFKDFDEKRLDASDKEFTLAIERWKELHRPRDEVVSLLKARANVRLDNKQFESSLQDYDLALDMMKNDGEDDKGLAKYPEYPDTFAGRALAKEGVADWAGAVRDYDKAISLWGGRKVEDRDPSLAFLAKDYDGINPYVLTFRGNSLFKLKQYDQAMRDYEAASEIFISELKDVARYSDARANYALSLYALEKYDESVKAMKDVIRRDPGYADMHVALAAHEWSKGNYLEAIKEWRFTCDRIAVGCDAYTDMNWVQTIRRWPDNLSTKLQAFLNREVPETLQKGSIAGKKMEG